MQLQTADRDKTDATEGRKKYELWNAWSSINFQSYVESVQVQHRQSLKAGKHSASNMSTLTIETVRSVPCAGATALIQPVSGLIRLGWAIHTT